MSVVIRRAADRFRTSRPEAGIETWHSFSYGEHYDADRLGFGPIRAINVEHLAPGAGYAPHRHAEVEIVTWVLSGALRHRDSTGAGGVIMPGTVQRLSAGAGVEHTEVNDSATEPLTFVQMMLASEHAGEPSYAAAQVKAGPLVATVGVDAAADLLIARPQAGEAVLLPDAERCLIHVTRGEVRLGGEVLATGDEAHAVDVTGLTLAAESPAEALVWLLDVSRGR